MRAAWKDTQGRGRKRAEWKEHVHEFFLDEAHRLRSAQVKLKKGT